MAGADWQLADAHLPSVVAALAHRKGLAWASAAMTRLEDDRDAVVAELSGILADVLASSSTSLSPLDEREVRSLMGLVVGGPVPDSYVPLLQEELGLAGTSSRAPVLDPAIGPEARADFNVVIIGAGASGLLAGIQLARAGLPFTIFEKNGDVGGTWLENAYPGCRVDVPNQNYAYSFAPNPGWSQHFCARGELLAYFRRCADEFGLRDRIRFGTTVERLDFDEATGSWHVTARGPDGDLTTTAARAVITAVGQLNRPLLPDIRGRDTFRGQAFHSARWDAACRIAGRRVAVIGSGASAIQIAPEIAPAAAELRIFQRTPPWLAPTPNYYDQIGEGQRWLLENLPFYANWYGFWLFWTTADSIYPMLKCDPAWGEPGSVSAANAELRQRLAAYIEAQAAGRPDLLAKTVPTYPPGGKRMLRDSGRWFATLKRSNVELVTDRIEEIAPTGIVTADGTFHEVDVIIYCTGFQASRFLEPIEIRGRNGVRLDDHWAGDARAYLGLTIPGFPNLFSLYGPNTNIAANGSIIFLSECGVRYIVRSIEMMLRSGARSLEVRQEVHDAFNEEVDRGNAAMAWGSPAISSWFKNEHGRVSQNWPFPLFEYWRRTLRPDPDDFNLT
jgi:4-hydroxyacetophenone monooxygenase